MHPDQDNTCKKRLILKRCRVLYALSFWRPERHFDMTGCFSDRDKLIFVSCNLFAIIYLQILWRGSSVGRAAD